MNVSEIMTTEPECIEVTASVKDALQIMMEHDIRHVPVLDKGELKGIISDRDIRLFSAPLSDDQIDLDDMHSHLKESIIKIMKGDVLYVGPEADVKDAIELMVNYRIGAVPVVDTREESLVGIISYIDILKAVSEQL